MIPPVAGPHRLRWSLSVLFASVFMVVVFAVTVPIQAAHGHVAPTTTSTTTPAIGTADVTDPVMADFDQDRFSDVLWRNNSNGLNLLWLMVYGEYKDFAFLPQVPDTDWQSVATGDFNGDDKPDILWRNSSNGLVYVWYMDGTTFPMVDGMYQFEGIAQVADLNWKIAGTGDVDGDGQTDIFWHNVADGRTVVWYMDGIVVDEFTVLATVPETEWRVAGLGEFNWDEMIDVLWVNDATGQTVLWLLNATRDPDTIVKDYVFLETQDDADLKLVALGDYNSDACVDLLWRNRVTGEVTIWDMHLSEKLAERMIDDPFVTNLDWQIGSVDLSTLAGVASAPSEEGTLMHTSSPGVPMAIEPPGGTMTVVPHPQSDQRVFLPIIVR